MSQNIKKDFILFSDLFAVPVHLNQNVFVCFYEPDILCVSNHTNAEHFFWSCLQVFRHVGPTQKVDCWARMSVRLQLQTRVRFLLESTKKLLRLVLAWY